MARVSRSSKKQPAFDPSELTDLIFSPAVGTGVGSHLVGPAEEFPAPIGHPRDLATVAVEDMATVVINEMATVAESDITTVDVRLVAIVDVKNSATVDRSGSATVDSLESTTVANMNLSTVDEPQRSGLGREVAVWITEEGGVVPGGRVRRIRLAQDVISSAEEAVYDTLWDACTADPGEGGEVSRVVQAGYDYLVKQTELSKRTIQRIVEKLIDKDFIAIERPADIYQRSSTVYRVFNYQTVLDRHMQKGRLHVAKLGPGFSYVRPLSEIRPQ